MLLATQIFVTAKNVDLIQELAYYVYYSFELKNTPAVV